VGESAEGEKVENEGKTKIREATLILSTVHWVARAYGRSGGGLCGDWWWKYFSNFSITIESESEHGQVFRY
jgi:hypothetical protein